MSIPDRPPTYWGEGLPDPHAPHTRSRGKRIFRRVWIVLWSVWIALWLTVGLILFPLCLLMAGFGGLMIVAAQPQVRPLPPPPPH